jgi:serine/threonine protein phosphatase PrpC
MKARLSVGHLADLGRERDTQEDAYALNANVVQRKGAIFVVADGVGGYAAGEQASKMAVRLIVENYCTDSDDDSSRSLKRAIESANTSIYEAAQSPGQERMGTTVVCAVIRDADLYVAHVGDSRAYLLRDSQLRQLTQDHSWVAEQVRLGMLSVQESVHHPRRNVIMRSLGKNPQVEPEVQVPGSLRDNDRLLLCTDGLYDGVSEDQIAKVLAQYPPQQACQRLIRLANEAGGSDNITAVIVEVHLEPEPVADRTPVTTLTEAEPATSVVTDRVEPRQDETKPLDLRTWQAQLEAERGEIERIRTQTEYEQQQIQSEALRLKQQQAQLGMQQNDLDKTRTQIEHERHQLELERTTLDEERSELGQVQARLENAQSELEHKRSLLEKTQRQYEDERRQFEQQSRGIREQLTNQQQAQTQRQIELDALEQSLRDRESRLLAMRPRHEPGDARAVYQWTCEVTYQSASDGRKEVQQSVQLPNGRIVRCGLIPLLFRVGDPQGIGVWVELDDQKAGCLLIGSGYYREGLPASIESARPVVIINGDEIISLRFDAASVFAAITKCEFATTRVATQAGEVGRKNTLFRMLAIHFVIQSDSLA